MDKIFNWISVVFGLIGGVLSYWLGGWDVLLKTIVFLAVVDYITGVIKGIYTKKLSSETGFKGLLKKIVMFEYNCRVFFHPRINREYNPIKRSCDHVLYL